MTDKEESGNSNSCTETGESDDSLSDLGIDSQNHIQPFMCVCVCVCVCV